MMADHMPDHITSVLGKMARSRRRNNPEFREQVSCLVHVCVCSLCSLSLVNVSPLSAVCGWKIRSSPSSLQAGPAVGSGTAGATGPASSYLAIDIDSESEEDTEHRS